MKVKMCLNIQRARNTEREGTGTSSSEDNGYRSVLEARSLNLPSYSTPLSPSNASDSDEHHEYIAK